MGAPKSRCKKGGSRAAELISSYEKIRDALEDDRFKYRTLRGVAKAAGISFERVQEEVLSHPKDIVVLSRKNQNGERLFTTRRHYRAKASRSEKILGAFLNRVY